MGDEGVTFLYLIPISESDHINMRENPRLYYIASWGFIPRGGCTWRCATMNIHFSPRLTREVKGNDLRGGMLFG